MPKRLTKIAAILMHDVQPASHQLKSEQQCQPRQQNLIKAKSSNRALLSPLSNQLGQAYSSAMPAHLASQISTSTQSSKPSKMIGSYQSETMSQSVSQVKVDRSNSELTSKQMDDPTLSDPALASKKAIASMTSMTIPELVATLPGYELTKYAKKLDPKSKRYIQIADYMENDPDAFPSIKGKMLIQRAMGEKPKYRTALDEFLASERYTDKLSKEFGKPHNDANDYGSASLAGIRAERISNQMQQQRKRRQPRHKQHHNQQHKKANNERKRMSNGQ